MKLSQIDALTILRAAVMPLSEGLRQEMRGEVGQALIRDAKDSLVSPVRELLAAKRAEIGPKTITDIEQHGAVVRYTFSDGTREALHMSYPEAGAVATAWKAGLKEGDRRTWDKKDIS